MAWSLQGNPNPLSNTNASSLNLVAWTGDGAVLPATPGYSSGFIYFCRAYVDMSASATHAYLALISAGTSMSNCYIGIYNAGVGGALLARTADISSTLMATPTTPLQFTFNSTPATTISAMNINTEIWLAFLIGAQSTSATFVGRANYGTNLGMTSDYRMWMTNSGGNTSLPSTVPATISASTTSQSMPFIAIGP